MFLKMSSEAWDRFSAEVLVLLENSTWNFVSRICFKIVVFRSLKFFKVKILSLGKRECFLIVLKTFLSK